MKGYLQGTKFEVVKFFSDSEGAQWEHSLFLEIPMILTLLDEGVKLQKRICCRRNQYYSDALSCSCGDANRHMYNSSQINAMTQILHKFTNFVIYHGKLER